ncbi:fibronectin type III domain-containing protein, partial [Bacteroidales bacterium OttesenSCG-928-B11]|nr:fibronectin type III domain-containing protein [Bacteroidales bacterium OttesenSCG-928-B11]
QTSGSTYYYDSPFSSFRTYLSGAGTWTYLISPRLSGDLSNYQFRMSCKAAEGALFIVGALDDLSDTVNFSTFQPIDTVSGQGLGTFERPDISFSDYDYDGEPHHIVIKMPFIDKKQDFSIDNIIISLNQNCRPATNVVVENVAGSVAQISWTPSTSTVSSYDVEYAPVDSTNWQSMGTEDANITLSGLFERTDYKVRVVSNCGETSERTEPVYFSTGCDAYSYREIAPQQNTNGGHLPTGNNYSVSQQLFLAEEFDNQQQSIEFLAFQFNNPKALNRELMIFMKHVADTAFSSTQNWADTATMQQVFNGTATLSNSGEDHWTTIQFKTPFQFNGTENLLVCVLDFTGSSHGVTSDVSSYYTHTTSTNRSMSVTSALSSRPIDLDSLKSNDIKISNNRSNIRFISCATADCAMPLLANITDVTKNALTLNWVDNGTPGFYIIEYKPDTNSDWQRDTTTNYPSHTINGLQSGVLYHIRIARLCTEAVSNFTTPLQARTSCDKISVPYYEYFDSYANDEEPACWITQSGDNTKTGVTTSIKYEGAASFRMSASRDTFCLAVLPEIEDEHLSTSLTVSFWAKTDDLSGEFSLGFITDMDDIPTFESTSTLILNTPDTWKRFDIPLFVDDNTKRLALVWQDGTTPLYIDQFQITVAADCPAPTELNSSQIGVNQATISWENEDATTDKWIVSHHIKNDSLSLSVDTVWAATALLDNLLPNTSYVVLVTAICGDMLSESSAPFYFTTRPALASTPYDCDFENASENMNWVLVNGNHVNTWNINTAANNTAQGTQSLYISAFSRNINPV